MVIKNNEYGKGSGMYPEFTIEEMNTLRECQKTLWNMFYTAQKHDHSPEAMDIWAKFFLNPMNTITDLISAEDEQSFEEVM